MAKTTAPTMRQMPPVLRLRAASTAGPTRGPAAPASPVMVPSLLRCYLLSHLLARLPLIGAAAEGDGHRRGGPVDRPQGDRRPGRLSGAMCVALGRVE